MIERIHVDFSQSVAKLWSQIQYRLKDNPMHDHIAKDFADGPAKFIIKDENTPHRGDNSRYEFVFDEEHNRVRKEKRYIEIVPIKSRIQKLRSKGRTSVSCTQMMISITR